MKNIKFILLGLSVLALAISCQKDEGRIPPTGDLKQGIIMPGKERVVLCMELKDGSKASNVEVVWGNGDDQKLSFDIDPNAGPIRQEIDVPEGSYTFRIHAYDANGNEVIDFPMFGKSCGANYIGTLGNRVPLFELDKENVGNLNIFWGANPAGSIRSVVSYCKVGVTDSVRVTVMPEQAETVLEDIVDKSSFSVLSYYYPEMKLYNPSTRPSSVPADFVYDEFAPGSPTSYTVGVPIDVTSLYIKNNGVGSRIRGTLNVSGEGEWGTPADWQVSPSLYNPKDPTKATPGGWRKRDSDDPAMGDIEFGTPWTDAPAESVINGKIWQTVEMMRGSYRIEIENTYCNTDPYCNLNLVAAKGAGLPDNEKLSEALAYTKVEGSGWWNHFTITFTLNETSEVSFGMVVSLDGTPGPREVGGMRWIKMEKLP